MLNSNLLYVVDSMYYYTIVITSSLYKNNDELLFIN